MSLDVTLTAVRETVVHDGNITHNLTPMAAEAGLYEALWCPEELGISLAGELAPLLHAGLRRLEAEPERYRRLNPPNRWGSYEGLVRFVSEYLAACEANPDAKVRVSR